MNKIYLDEFLKAVNIDPTGLIFVEQLDDTRIEVIFTDGITATFSFSKPTKLIK